MPRVRFRLGEWEVNPSELSISSRDEVTEETTKLEPKTMAVLELLVARAPEVVSIDQLLSNIWKGTVVGDTVVYRAITLLRRVFKEDSKQPKIIESIPRKGYRIKALIAPLDDHINPSHGVQSSPLGHQPSLGRIIISLNTASETSSELHPLVSGLASHLTWLSDAYGIQINPGSNSDQNYKIHLHHQIESEGQALQWQLYESAMGTLIWSGKQLLTAKDPSSTSRTAETLAGIAYEQIRRHKTQTLSQLNTDFRDMSYWELILTADQFDGMKAAKVEERDLRLTRAIDIFPNLSPAYAAYADLLSWQVLNGIGKDFKQLALMAKQAANTAIDIDRDSPYVLSRCGTVYTRLGEYERGIQLCRRALDFAPSTSSREALARTYCFAGQPDKAIDLLLELLKALPKGASFRYGKLVVAMVQSGQIADALAYSYNSISNYPKDYYAWVLHCNILYQLEQEDAAIRAWQEAERLAPLISLEQSIIGTIRTYGRTEAQIGFLTGGLRSLQQRLDQ